ncbi:hypothetical protein D9M69_612780 [compost metagenome]
MSIGQHPDPQLFRSFNVDPGLRCPRVQYKTRRDTVGRSDFDKWQRLFSDVEVIGIRMELQHLMSRRSLDREIASPRQNSQ